MADPSVLVQSKFIVEAEKPVKTARSWQYHVETVMSLRDKEEEGQDKNGGCRRLGAQIILLRLPPGVSMYPCSLVLFCASSDYPSD